MGEVLFFGRQPKSAQMFDGRRQIHVMMPKGTNKIRVGIYRLWFKDKFYIGRANNIRTRVKGHMKQIEYAFHTKKPNGWFHDRVIKFLDATPDFSIIMVEVLEECNESLLNEREQFYITKYKDDPNMLNVATVAVRTAKDKARTDFKVGVYRIDFNLVSLEQFLQFKKIASLPNVRESGFLKEF